MLLALERRQKSHAMLVCVVMGSAMMLMKKYVKNSKSRLALQTACVLIIAVTVVGRLISGVHWFTDIIGGILVSTPLLLLYSAVIEKMNE